MARFAVLAVALVLISASVWAAALLWPVRVAAALVLNHPPAVVIHAADGNSVRYVVTIRKPAFIRRLTHALRTDLQPKHWSQVGAVADDHGFVGFSLSFASSRTGPGTSPPDRRPTFLAFDWGSMYVDDAIQGAYRTHMGPLTAEIYGHALEPRTRWSQLSDVAGVFGIALRETQAVCGRFLQRCRILTSGPP